MNLRLRKLLRKIINHFGVYRLYFTRGYGLYFALILTIINTSILFYNFIVIKVPFLLNIFGQFWVFTTLFVMLLIPAGVIIGYLDYKRGPYRQEQLEIKKRSPVWKEVFEDFEQLKKELRELKEEIRSLRSDERAK